jgi:hypothetical protein
MKKKANNILKWIIFYHHNFQILEAHIGPHFLQVGTSQTASQLFLMKTKLNFFPI